MIVRYLVELTMFVTDLDASANFYGALGLDVFENNEPGYTRHFDVDLGEKTMIQLFPASETHAASHVQLGFHVHDVAAVASQLDQHGYAWDAATPTGSIPSTGRQPHPRPRTSQIS